MEYVLTGFQQDRNIRQYAFEEIGADRTRRTKFTVGVDLGLIRKYAISVQELPLLCRHFLEGHAADGQATLTFTEEEMVGHANRRSAALHAAEEKKAHRKHPSGGGQAWRSPRTTQPASE